MFRNISSLKYTHMKSMNFKRYYALYKIIQRDKNTVNSFCYPLFVSNQKMSNSNHDYKYTQALFKKAMLNEIKLLKKYLSTTANNYNNKESEDPAKNKGDPQRPNFLVIFLVGLIYYLIFVVTSNNSAVDQSLVSWEEFKHEMLAKGEVKKLVLYMDLELVQIILHEGAIYKNKPVVSQLFHMKTPEIARFEEKVREAERQLGISIQNAVPIQYYNPGFFGAVIKTLPYILFLWFLFALGKSFRKTYSSQFLNISKAKFTLIDPLSGQGKGVKFSDVAGLKEAKMEIMEFVDYLKRPEDYKVLGAKVPKGALLLGPPGCGKTLLAKAVATEANVPFLSMNGSEFIEMIGGLGAARVRSLFREAKNRIPCIVFIDEIDAIGRKRSGEDFNRGDREGEQTLNQLLVEMDGMVSNEGVVLLASTNRANVLDSALLRPGRFDRQILIDLPTFEERRQIFEHHLKSIHLEQAPEFYSKRLAHLTPGFSGADIANVCNEAALHAARFKKKIVQGEDLEYAVERVVGGTEKRSSVLSPEEKEMLAYQEAGRALVGWFSEYGDALLKITIVSRTHSPEGWTQFSQSDKFLYSKEELMGKMCMGLGGRVAVSLIFNRITTGAEKDLKKITRLAYAQIREFGMSEKIGLISFDKETTEPHVRKPYSKHLGSLIDQEARQLVAKAYKEAETILLQHKDQLCKLATELLKRETLNYNDVVKLLGPPPHKDKKLIDPLDFQLSLDRAAGPEPEPEPEPGPERRENSNEP